MKISESLTIEDGGKITLPDAVRERYRLTKDTSIRIIETRNGILLVPLTEEPMTDALSSELEEWQWLSTQSLELFPYEDKEE